MNTSIADVLLIENNDDDAELALQAIRQGVPASIPHRVKTCDEAMRFLYVNNSISDQAGQLRMIVMNLGKNASCSVESLKTIKNNKYTQHVHVISILNAPGCLDVFSEAIKAGTTLCMIKNAEFADKLKQELGYYWQLFE